VKYTVQIIASIFFIILALPIYAVRIIWHLLTITWFTAIEMQEITVALMDNIIKKGGEDE